MEVVLTFVFLVLLIVCVVFYTPAIMRPFTGHLKYEGERTSLQKFLFYGVSIALMIGYFYYFGFFNEQYLKFLNIHPFAVGSILWLWLAYFTSLAVKKECHFSMKHPINLVGISVFLLALDQVDKRFLQDSWLDFWILVMITTVLLEIFYSTRSLKEK